MNGAFVGATLGAGINPGTLALGATGEAVKAPSCEDALWVFAGLSMAVALLVGVYVLASWLFFDTARGWASLTLVIAFFSAVQLFCLGMLGEYVGRIYGEAKGRPLYVLREIVAQAPADARARDEEPVA